MDLERRIASRLSELTPNDLQVARHLVSELPHTAFGSAQEIADQLGVSKAAVVRCANRLGYQGFTELRKALRDYVNQQLESPVELFQEHRRSLEEDSAAVVAERLGQALQNLQELAASAKSERLDDIARRLARADRIVVAGERKSWGLAVYAAHILRMLRPGAEVWPTPSQPLPEMALDLSESDALMALTFRRYSNSVLRLARVAQEQGTWVLALTDSIVAPIVAASDETIICPTEDVSFVDSMVSPTFVIETIAVRLSRELGPQVNERLEGNESLAEESGLFVRSPTRRG